jgi:hypothetical protein
MAEKTAEKPEKVVALIGKPEKVPATCTYYFNITLGGDLPHETGVFFPEKYQPGDKLDVIVYLAGIDIGGLRSYWRAEGTYTLRESLNASGRNYVLVVPTVSVQGEPGAKFTTVGALASSPASYFEQVIRGISQQDPFDKGWKEKDRRPKLGRIVVAGHSGGGFDLPKLALAIQANKIGTLAECWGFDCLYFGNLDQWVALGKTGLPVYLYYIKKKLMIKGQEVIQDTTTSTNAAKLQAMTTSLPNVVFNEVLGSVGYDHPRMPARFLVERAGGIKAQP